MWTEFLFIFLLIIANGVFAMSEAAMISARQARLQQRADEGDVGAAAALRLLAEPDRFLSTVQIGITLIGILSGAIGGSTLSRSVEPLLAQVPLLAPYSQTLSVLLVVLLITYLSLVIGELVPKRLALVRAESIAAHVARPMQALSRLTAPVVALLSVSTRFVLALFGVRASDGPLVTEDEVRIMLAQGTEAGVFDEDEQQMVENVFRLADWRVSAVMTPHTEIIWLDLDAPTEETRDAITSSRLSAYPVFQRDQRNLVGVVLLEDLWAQVAGGEPLNLRTILRPPLYIPENVLALRALDKFRRARQDMAMVIDEHGGIAGIVTTGDILDAITSGLSDAPDPEIVQRADGSWLVDGMLNIDEFEDYLDMSIFPDEERNAYETLGGFVMMRIGQIPRPADQFDWAGLRFEVVDMDGRRVDKILVTRLIPEMGDDSA